jgi:2-polyprenyl-3-methyl-5-hydroxy-6-metoxy-1,4-benzoquinol methylase
VRCDLGDRVPFDAGTVDVVHYNKVIEHLRGTDYFMAEIRRILRPDGYAVVSTNNLASLHTSPRWSPASSRRRRGAAGAVVGRFPRAAVRGRVTPAA